MTELNTQIELIVSEIIGATRKAKTLEDLSQVNTNGINDITKLVKKLALSGVVSTFKDKETMTFEEYKTKELEHKRIYEGNYEHRLYGWISVDSFVNMYLKDLNL